MKYTVEEVRAEADFLSTYSRKPSQMLTAYADSIERAQAGVTDKVVQRVADELDELFAVEDAQEPAFLHDVRRILLAVWPSVPALAAQVDIHPKHGDMHDGCGGYWCDYVQAEYKKPGPITLHESNIVRYVKLGLMCDKCGVERPTAEPVAQPADSGRVGDGFKFDDDGIRLALDYSRNYATARPDISPTAKEHVMGLCDRLESLLSDRAALAAQGQSSASPAGVPERWVLVPARFGISKDAWEAAQFAFGGPGTGEDEEFMDCTAWIGEIENDDGSKTHGIHIQCDECPEEGSITLAEFAAAPPAPEGDA